MTHHARFIFRGMSCHFRVSFGLNWFHSFSVSAKLFLLCTMISRCGILTFSIFSVEKECWFKLQTNDHFRRLQSNKKKKKNWWRHNVCVYVFKWVNSVKNHTYIRWSVEGSSNYPYTTQIFLIATLHSTSSVFWFSCKITRINYIISVLHLSYTHWTLSAAAAAKKRRKNQTTTIEKGTNECVSLSMNRYKINNHLISDYDRVFLVVACSTRCIVFVYSHLAFIAFVYHSRFDQFTCIANDDHEHAICPVETILKCKIHAIRSLNWDFSLGRQKTGRDICLSWWLLKWCLHQLSKITAVPNQCFIAEIVWTSNSLFELRNETSDDDDDDDDNNMNYPKQGTTWTIFNNLPEISIANRPLVPVKWIAIVLQKKKSLQLIQQIILLKLNWTMKKVSI